jgi:hypothetical protein
MAKKNLGGDKEYYSHTGRREGTCRNVLLAAKDGNQFCGCVKEGGGGTKCTASEWTVAPLGVAVLERGRAFLRAFVRRSKGDCVHAVFDALLTAQAGIVQLKNVTLEGKRLTVKFGRSLAWVKLRDVLQIYGRTSREFTSPVGAV